MMAKKTLGIGLIGAGAKIAEVHARAFAEIPNCELIACWNRSAERAHAFAEKQGIEVYDKYSDLMADPKIDAVDICLASGLHAEFGVAAAGAGKHVILEYPIDVKPEEGERLIDACHDRDVQLMVVFQSRYKPGIRKLKQAIDRGVLGELILANAEMKCRVDDSYYTSKGWTGNRSLEGGVLLHQGAQILDLLLFFLGSPKTTQAYCRSARAAMEAEDLVVSTIEFTNGAMGVVQASTALSPESPERIEIPQRRPPPRQTS